MAKQQPSRMSTEDFRVFSSKIQEAWGNTSAIVAVIEFDRKSELPKWQDCRKNEVWVGVKKRKIGDRLVLIKHKTEMELNLKCSVMDLKDEELKFVGFLPGDTQHCSECGDFTTSFRVVLGKKICCDCADRRKEREREATA